MVIVKTAVIMISVTVLIVMADGFWTYQAMKKHYGNDEMPSKNKWNMFKTAAVFFVVLVITLASFY